jgi:formylglycine-generating enzyme required for sulfatase activity
VTLVREDSAEESRLAEAIAEYLELGRAGRAPPISDFARAHPDIEGPLRTCLGVLEGLPGGAPTAPETPRVLGDFRIVRLIGRGGMGLVYEAEQISLPRKVALKVLLPGASADRERLARFQREVEATARLRHRNIVPVYEAGEASGLPYYAMPLLRGRSLELWVRDTRGDPSRAPLSSRRELVAWVGRFIDVARALAEAHDSGILHRDIKPSNLFLEDDGRLLILDFGLTRSSIDPGASLTGGPIGTPRYMSPEQILARRLEVDGRSDLFSLGATMYEVLTLQPAFPGEDRESIFRAILSEDPPRPRRVDPRAPRDLEVVLLKALEKEPGRRYASVREFADDLQRFLDYEPLRARPVGGLARIARRAQRNPLAAGAILLAAAALLTIGAYPAIQGFRHRRDVSQLLERGSALLGLGQAEGARDVAVQLELLEPGNQPAAHLKQAALSALREERELAARAESERRAASELASAREAGGRLADLRDRRAELVRELELEERRVATWAPLPDKARLFDLRQASDALLEEREQAFREALSHLLSALQLAPDPSGARRELASLAFDEYRAAERARDRGRMESLRPLIEAYDDGALREQWRGLGSLALESEPAGAEVFLFRYEERDLRLLPVPFSLASGADRAWLEAQPARGPWVLLHLTAVETPDAPLAAGDELVAVCGSPPASLKWVLQHLRQTHYDAQEEEHVIELVRDGEAHSVRLRPTSLRMDGRVEQSEAFPLRCGELNFAGRTPLAPRELAMGSYLAILRLDGRAEARVPFVIDRQERERLSIPLLEREALGEGFVYVPPGPAILGGDPDALAAWPLQEVALPGYCIQRSEVTFGEYFEFLRDLEETDPKLAQELAPRGTFKSMSLDPMWKLDGDGRIQPDLPFGMDASHPALSLTYRDTQAYCAWLNRKSAVAGVEYSLPTEQEWEKAARGADGRLFAWGNGLEWTFARLGRSSRPTSPQWGGVYATDESVYGARDLNGNLREWCLGPEDAPVRVLRGGAWESKVEGNCHLACRADQRDPRFRDFGTGFRVVKRFVER